MNETPICDEAEREHSQNHARIAEYDSIQDAVNHGVKSVPNGWDTARSLERRLAEANKCKELWERLAVGLATNFRNEQIAYPHREDCICAKCLLLSEFDALNK